MDPTRNADYIIQKYGDKFGSHIMCDLLTFNYKYLLEKLIENGFDFKAKGNYPTDLDCDVTPLESALEYHNYDIAEILLKHGARCGNEFQIIAIGHNCYSYQYTDLIRKFVELLQKYEIEFNVNIEEINSINSEICEYWREYAPDLYELYFETSITKSATMV